MLEKMDDFFAARVSGYDEHMRTTIEGAEAFYAYTASLLPVADDGKEAHVLDLGCGTGLELEQYFKLAPEAHVTGIDLSDAMLNALKQKFPNKKLSLINGSYFEIPLGKAVFDAAVSVESLHHFTAEKKEGLYRRLHAALKNSGYFVLTDYFAMTDEEETARRQELLLLRKEQNLPDGEFYHYDTPLTVEHEKEALIAAGFSDVQVLREWGTTVTLRAIKEGE